MCRYGKLAVCRSVDFPKFIIGCSLKLVFKLEEVDLQFLQSLLHSLVRVIRGSLHLHLQDIIQRMRHSVPRELHLGVLQKIDSKQISHCVVFERDSVGDRVDHLLSLLDFDVIATQFLLVISTQLQSEVLTH